MTNRYTNVPKSDNKPENVVIIRGGGDLASGTIHRLYRCGYRLLVLECEKPTAIRRMVSFCEAVYDGQSSVEGVLCRKVDSVEECEAVQHIHSSQYGEPVMLSNWMHQQNLE